MPVELRPDWCVDDDTVHELFELGPWVRSDGKHADELDGDDWRPGHSVDLSRSINIKIDYGEVRRRFRLGFGREVRLAARWLCRASVSCGTHDGGPSPLPVTEDLALRLCVPRSVADEIELETCLIGVSTAGSATDATCPNGGLIWSDSWTIPRRDRLVTLEGDEGRIPVRTVSFEEHYGHRSDALWAIDLESGIEPDEPVSNVVTVTLNHDVLSRDFPNDDGEPDPSRIPDPLLTAVRVELCRLLTGQLSEYSDDLESLGDADERSVGAMIGAELLGAFGSVSLGFDAFRDDQPAFIRRLWTHLAPDSWSTR